MYETLIIKDLVISTVKELNYWSKNQDSLRRRLLVEFRINLALIDMTNWIDISNDFKYYLLKQLQTDAIELAIGFSSNTIFTPIFEYFSFEDENGESSGIIFSQLISKIKALKVIAHIPEELSVNNKALVDIRIKNIKKIILQLLIELEGNKNLKIK